MVIKEVSKLFGLNVGRTLQALPFFYVSEDVESNFCSRERINEQGYGKQYPEFVVPMTDYEMVDDLLPFHNFSIMDHQIGWHSVHWLKDGLWRITICMDRQLSDLGIPIPPGSLMHVAMLVSPLADMPPEDPEETIYYDAEIRCHLLAREDTKMPPGISSEMAESLNSMFMDEKFRTTMSKQMVTNISYFLSFFKWAEGMHMVEAKKRPTKQDLKTAAKGNKKPWTRGDMPHYIYLDAPHSTSGKGEHTPGESGRKVRGHHRRAHWRTLRDPRFKNHPKYGIPMRIKQMWVGPTDWTVGDTIYTVKGELNDERTKNQGAVKPSTVRPVSVDDGQIKGGATPVQSIADQHADTGQLAAQGGDRDQGQDRSGPPNGTR